MEDFKLKTVTGIRGGTLILHKQFRFAYARSYADGKMKWRCCTKSCKAVLYSTAAYIFRGEGLDHNHATKKREILSTKPKRQALAKKDGVDNHGILETYPVATSRIENVLQSYKSDNIIVFSCVESLKFMCSSSDVYMDGTLDYSTNFFKQLFTIHAMKNNVYVPVAFCMLINKCIATYTKLFNNIISMCHEHGLIFNPKGVAIDFEKSIRTAVETCWPNSVITDCKFNLSRNCFRTIQKLELVSEYKNSSSEIGKWLRNTFGMTLLKPDMIRDYLDIVLFFFCNLYFQMCIYTL